MGIINIDLDKLSESERAQILSIAEKANAKKADCFPGVKDGETFTVGDMEFIKFPDKGGMTPVMMRDVAFTSRFGDNNDLRKSDVLARMEKEILPKVIEAIGEENVCTFKTDLTTLDGLKPYGEMESRISLPNLDFYRAHVDIFDKYKVDKWCWLATPESAQPHCDPDWILCVSPSGIMISGSCNIGNAVRPVLYFVSSIFESSEE